MSDTTTNLLSPYILAAQAQKQAIEALRKAASALIALENTIRGER